MNYRVELHHKETNERAHIVVKEVHYTEVEDYWVRLVGTDPSCYPDFARDVGEIGETRIWISKDLSLYLALDDPINVIGVVPTDGSVPRPDVPGRGDYDPEQEPPPFTIDRKTGDIRINNDS